MIISHKFLEEMERNKNIRIHKLPIGHYHYEYAKEHYAEGIVMGVLELEHPIISDLDNKVIGYFGMSFEHNILAYYLKI